MAVWSRLPHQRAAGGGEQILRFALLSWVAFCLDGALSNDWTPKLPNLGGRLVIVVVVVIVVCVVVSNVIVSSVVSFVVLEAQLEEEEELETLLDQ